VHAIYTQQDLARFKVDMLSFFLTGPEVEITPLANGRVAYVGEPVALVIADSRHIAEDAASLVEIEYAEEDPVVSIADARRGRRFIPAPRTTSLRKWAKKRSMRISTRCSKGAPHLITHKVVHQRISQSPMETRGIVATRDGNEELTLYITCQSPHLVARWTSLALGLPQTAIRVIAKDVGGGFGLKNHPWKEEVSVILAALKFGRPLKWIEDRYENLIAANQAREAEMVLQGGIRCGRSAAGLARRLQLQQRRLSAAGGLQYRGADVPVGGVQDAGVWLPARGWYTNTVGLAAYRGPWAMESLIRETALDVAARRMGIDPIEIRRRNLVRLKDQPTVSSMGIPLEDITPAECLDKLLENFDVAAFRWSRQPRGKKAAISDLGLRPISNRRGQPAASPR
jgi:carbon-monoxide dehydrogenase large subunit